MSTFIEGKLKFSFDSAWQVVKYDDKESEYRKRVTLDETKAVDFLGILTLPGRQQQFFIEVKDFTDHETENKERVASGKLAIEIAQKVRDTVAGIVGIWKTGQDSMNVGPREFWGKHVSELSKVQSEISVLCFFKSIPIVTTVKQMKKNRQRAQERLLSRRKNEAQVLKKAIENQLKWLTKRVWVQPVEDDDIYGISIANLKR